MDQNEQTEPEAVVTYVEGEPLKTILRIVFM